MRDRTVEAYTKTLGPDHTDTIRARQNRDNAMKSQDERRTQDSKWFTSADARNRANAEYYLQLWVPRGTVAVVHHMPMKIVPTYTTAKKPYVKVNGDRYTINVPALLSRPTAKDIAGV